MKRLILSTLLPLVVLFAAGCGIMPRFEADDTQAVRQTVMAYTEALARGFETLDMNALNQVATEEQATQAFFLMAALGESRVRMTSELKDIEFGEVTFAEEGQASATTTETWDYDHISIDTSETVRSERGVVYRLRYDLALTDGRWFVTNVTCIDETPESEESTPGIPPGGPGSEESTPSASEIQAP